MVQAQSLVSVLLESANIANAALSLKCSPTCPRLCRSGVGASDSGLPIALPPLTLLNGKDPIALRTRVLCHCYISDRRLRPSVPFGLRVPPPLREHVSSGAEPGYSSESCGRDCATAGSPKEPDLAEDCVAETPLNDTPYRESFGSVEGTVEKLAQSHAAKFAVYPDDASRGVPCYVSDEDEAKMAEALAQACPSRGTAPTRFQLRAAPVHP